MYIVATENAGSCLVTGSCAHNSHKVSWVVVMGPIILSVLSTENRAFQRHLLVTLWIEYWEGVEGNTKLISKINKTGQKDYRYSKWLSFYFSAFLITPCLLYSRSLIMWPNELVQQRLFCWLREFILHGQIFLSHIYYFLLKFYKYQTTIN